MAFRKLRYALSKEEVPVYEKYKPNYASSIVQLKTKIGRSQGSYSLLRLLREIEQLQTEKVPLVNVVAIPKSDNIYVWRGLLSGPTNSLYEGVYIRFEMHLSPNYPLEPPLFINVISPTPITHPFIINNQICLEIFNKEKSTGGKGWHVGYTVSSILQQLQGFLWEGHYALKRSPGYLANRDNLKISTKGFKYGDKKEGWPGEFSDKVINLQEFKQTDPETSIYKK